MESNWPKALDFVLREEGGYSNDPHDPGGATNFGITQRTYSAWRRLNGLPSQQVKKITLKEVGEIYRKQYWGPVCGDELPDGVDLMVFDEAVNSGPVRAVKDLQTLLGVRSDGVVGTHTLDALHRKADLVGLIGGLASRRLAWLRRLASWKWFGKGWRARVEAGKKLATEMALGR